MVTCLMCNLITLSGCLVFVTSIFLYFRGNLWLASTFTCTEVVALFTLHNILVHCTSVDCGNIYVHM